MTRDEIVLPAFNIDKILSISNPLVSVAVMAVIPVIQEYARDAVMLNVEKHGLFKKGILVNDSPR